MSAPDALTTLDVLKSAAMARSPVQFRYTVPGKAEGLRTGNPHAAFAHDGTGNLLVHIVQTAGASDSGGLPRFGTFKVQYIEDLVVLHDQAAFQVDPAYNRHSPMYSNALFLI